jgi:hypothetical protein
MPIDHEFGDQHTELKLSIVEKYLKFFTTALRGNSASFGTWMPSQGLALVPCDTKNG